MAKKKTKVKDIAKEFGVSPATVIKEMKSEGFNLRSASNVIDDDILDLVREHMKDLGGGEESASAEESQTPGEKVSGDEVHLKPPLTVKSVADSLGKKPNELISELMSMNILASINQTLEPDTVTKIADKFGIPVVIEKREKEEHLKHAGASDEIDDLDASGDEDRPEDLKPRAPVVTFLGHVDHGKTSIQDQVRQTDIAAGESGGITQHIGASTIKYKGHPITFIDTPGHEAFTAMRARGANVTDIAILVVAADDGFMPQTVEALEHARAAGIPIIVAINKIDLPGADPEKILVQMQQNNLMSEDWGGEVGTVKLSAKTGEGVEDLIDRILLESEMLELKANPKGTARAVVLEARLEQGLGPSANVLVVSGTLKIGDPIICGEHFGKIKAMINEHGKRVKKAGPSTPVKVVGLSGVPNAGAAMKVCENEREARRVADERGVNQRQDALGSPSAGDGGLEDLLARFSESQKKTLKLVLKADVKGSLEAIIDSLNKLPSEKITVDVILSGVGGITENDVLLASASGAIVIGFHARVNPGVNSVAKRENVEIRLYSVIYELIEDITEALTGRLDPDKREVKLGEAKILQIFDVSKGPKVCGCRVESGTVQVGAMARVHRDGELIFNGQVQSLRRFQDDVKQVKQGLECGIRLDNFLDFQEDDVIEIYKVEFKKATL